MLEERLTSSNMKLLFDRCKHIVKNIYNLKMLPIIQSTKINWIKLCQFQ